MKLLRRTRPLHVIPMAPLLYCHTWLLHRLPMTEVALILNGISMRSRAHHRTVGENEGTFYHSRSRLTYWPDLYVAETSQGT
eukprot:2205100-Pyramimonas_sp.AAC.1